MLGAILLTSLLLVRVAGGPLTRMRSYLDLAFMGAAFLLLETTLEYLSPITGHQFLLIVTAVLYGLAFITGRRRAAAQQPAGR